MAHYAFPHGDNMQCIYEQAEHIVFEKPLELSFDLTQDVQQYVI